MFRFFSSDLTFNSTEIAITNPAEIHHLRNVLRLKEGMPIVLFNSPNIEAQAVIESISSNCVQCRAEKTKTIPVPTTRILMACAIPKKSKFETIIEKSVELGVSEIIPLKTRRTIITLSGDRLEKRQKRYETIALNAVKQSRQTQIPRIHPVTDFSSLINNTPESANVLIPSLESKTVPILTALNNLLTPDTILFLIGPEGDFTPEEYKNAQDVGAIAVSLGPTILKVETAALTALAVTKCFTDNYSIYQSHP